MDASFAIIMAQGFSTMGNSSLYRSVTKIRDNILSRKRQKCWWQKIEWRGTKSLVSRDSGQHVLNSLNAKLYVSAKMEFTWLRRH